jgi:hypothetical protein
VPVLLRHRLRVRFFNASIGSVFWPGFEDAPVKACSALVKASLVAFCAVSAAEASTLSSPSSEPCAAMERLLSWMPSMALVKSSALPALAGAVA